MKHSSTWFASILILSASVLSGVPNANAASRNLRPNQHKEQASKETETAQSQRPEPTIPLQDGRVTQSALLDALNALHAEQEARAKHDQPEYEPWYAPSVLPQIVLCVIGAFYTYYAFRQWGAIKEQGKTARQQLENTERAFVFIKGMSVTKVLDASRRNVALRFVFNWENSGTTPTKSCGWHTNVYWPPVPITKGFWFLPFGDPAPLPLVLGPKAQGGTQPLDVPIEILRKVNTEEVHIYFYGWATYTDIFFPDTPEHRTRFCYKVAGVFGDLDNPSPDLVIAVTTFVHSEHNDAS